MVPVVAASLTWVWILNPSHGLVNGILARIGLDGPNWLASEKTALFSLVIVSVWGSGRAVLIYLAGLKEIPQHLYEAASIDGATPWRKMWADHPPPAHSADALQRDHHDHFLTSSPSRHRRS